VKAKEKDKGRKREKNKITIYRSRQQQKESIYTPSHTERISKAKQDKRKFDT
jgi:hypothetical protein